MESDRWRNYDQEQRVSLSWQLLHAMERVEQAEQLDLGVGSPLDVAQNLREMQRINAWFGGTTALTQHLFPLLSGLDDPVRIVDAGTGSAGLAATIHQWARRRKRQVHVVGLDWARRNLRTAATTVRARPAIQLLQGDARHLPLHAGSVDFIVSLLLMHHFSPGRLVELLRESYRSARRGIVMSDLVRGRLPYLAFHLIMPFVARHRLTREDGLLSIRRAYTPQEMQSIALEAGLPDPVVHTHWPWRMTLVALK